MARTIVARWHDWAGVGIEHLVLDERPDGIAVDSVIVGADFGLRYRLSCDAGWRILAAHIELVGVDHAVTLAGDGNGAWTDGRGGALVELRGAIDIDIAATPFTNTLPLRRLGLGAGASAEIVVAYVAVPDLRVTAERQRYTCLEPGRLYRFESLDGDFTRDIEVDADGLVVTYPGLFRRAR
ncbi:MAG: putative glycolipid-binding domain-containing protein [Candidatus Eiseniibacteriota bacterium]